MQRRMIFAFAGLAAAMTAHTAAAQSAGASFPFWVAAGGNAPLVYGSEPVALKICNGNSYLVSIIVDGATVRPRANACVIVTGKDIQTARIAGTPPTTDQAAFTITVEILGVKQTSDD